MALLAIDVGTTHCKAGLFAETGTAISTATRPMERSVGTAGGMCFSPNRVWQAVQQVVREATTAAGSPCIAAIGIASMAETGLLLDRRTGEARTDLLPWFDSGAAPHVARIVEAAPEAERFACFGIHPSAKNSVTKILWAQAHLPNVLEHAIWLSTADYIAFRLTGAHATDYSLAGRTYAFDLGKRTWHEAWLESLRVPKNLFPVALPSGTPVGVVQGEHANIGLSAGAPVAISGHDHVCAAIAASAAKSGRSFDSMGTAEALLGAFDHAHIGEAAHASGLTFGVLPLTNSLYWLGGLSTSGGALDWLRGVLHDPPLSYNGLHALQDQLDVTPGTVTFLPYLAGSGAPVRNAQTRGAFVGLGLEHTRADLLKAVLEGTAYQLQAIRRAAEALLPHSIDTITVAGGGARNQRWLQIKADVYGLPIHALAMDEATMLGAALIAGVGCGVYSSADQAFVVAAAQPAQMIEPDRTRHATYADRFHTTFLPWMHTLAQTSVVPNE